MAMPESLLIEGRDPTVPLEGEGVDVGQYDVYGRGQQEDAGLPFLPPQTMAMAIPRSYRPSLMEAPVAPSSAPTAEVLREGSTPAEDLGPLLGANDEYEKSTAELYQAEQDALAAHRAYQEAAMAGAREQIETGYRPIFEAARETESLMEEQRLRRPPVPTPPVEPAVPQQRIEPFGVGPEKETGMQALNRITMTLGLLAQMGMGMKSGYTQGAMAAFSGALDGWAKGQQIKAQQEWKEYLANVQKIDREWARERQHFDDILRVDGIDLDRAKTKMAIRQTELGYSKALVDLTLRDVDQRFKMLGVEQQVIQNLMKNSLTAMNMRMLAQQKELDRAVLEKYRAGVLANQAMTNRLREMQAGTAAAAQRAQEINMREQRRLQEAQIGAFERRTDVMGERQGAAGGQRKREMDMAANNAMRALDQVEQIISDPRSAKDLQPYLGKGGESWLNIKSTTTYPFTGKSVFPAPPKAATDAQQQFSTIKNHILNLISGKQVTGYEEKRLTNMLADMGSTPEVLARRVANLRPLIEWLQQQPNKGEPGTPTPMPEERTYGATLLYGVGAASKFPNKYVTTDDKRNLYSDGRQWWEQNKRTGKWTEVQ